MKFYEFFKQRVPNMPAPNDKGEVMVQCLFHKDSSASLGINVETGAWHCFAPHCPASKGSRSYKKFDALLRGESLPGGTAADVGEPIPDATIEGFHQVLLQSTRALEFLQNKRGLTLETIKRRKLGFDSDRYWIPVADRKGQWVNVRKYKPGVKKDKMVAYGVGYNQARLFPADRLDSPVIILCEGEMDQLIGEQHGFPTMTTTGGADTWLADFNRLLKGKRVYLCYDCDPAGVQGARSVAQKLLPDAAEVRIVKLPLAGTSEEKDLTNYFVDLGHSADDFQALLDAAELVTPNVATGGPSEEVIPIHLSEIGEDRLVGKRVSSTVLVAGKDLAPFQVPYKISYACEMGEKFCTLCGICKGGGQLEVTVPEWDPNLLQMVNVHQLTVDAVVANLANVPAKCRKFKHEVKEHANVEAIKAIPEIDFASERSAYVIRQLFYLGHGLETNHTYKIKAVVMPEPKTQYATAVIYEATLSEDSIEKFELTPDTMQQLSIFKVKP